MPPHSFVYPGGQTDCGRLWEDGASPPIWTPTLPPVDDMQTHTVRGRAEEPDLVRECLQKMAGRLVKIALYKTEKQSWPHLQSPNPPLRLSTPLLSSRSICLRVNSWAHGETLSQGHWKRRKPWWRALGILALCAPLLLTAHPEWINQTTGLRTLLVSCKRRALGASGTPPLGFVKRAAVFQGKIPHDGRAAEWHFTVTAPC